MIAVAAWAWVIVGLLVFLLLGLLVAVALGLVGVPGDFVRRAGQTAAGPRVDERGAVPGEVPEATAEETADEAERERGA